MGLNNFEFECTIGYSPDGCRVCLQLTINAITWQFQRRVFYQDIARVHTCVSANRNLRFGLRIQHPANISCFQFCLNATAKRNLGGIIAHTKTPFDDFDKSYYMRSVGLSIWSSMETELRNKLFCRKNFVSFNKSRISWSTLVHFLDHLISSLLLTIFYYWCYFK